MKKGRKKKKDGKNASLFSISTKTYSLATEVHMSEQLAQSCNPTTERLGVEPASKHFTTDEAI